MPKTLFPLFVVRKHKKATIIGAAIVMTASTVVSVYAHQSPGGCNSNRLNLSITKNKTEVRQGDVLTYSVTASNLNSGSDIACDITDADITVRLPAPDGTPTGTLVTIATNQSYPGNTPVTSIGSAQYTVNVNPGVEDIVAEGRIEGVLHDAPVDHSAQVIKTLGTTVVQDEDDGEDGGNDTQENEPTPGDGTSETSAGGDAILPAGAGRLK